MQIKRGRPKKEWQGEAIADKINKINHSKGSAGINRLYIDKDGSRCLVTYSGCKDKPEIIQYK
jgi:hypothetical protein